MLSNRISDQSVCSSSGRDALPPQASVRPCRWRVVSRVASQIPDVDKSAFGSEWTYKYDKKRCASHCPSGDTRCQQVEALVQNVLRYPYLPPRIVRWLPKLSQSVDAMTELVERMSAHFGNELAFTMINKQPCILDVPFPVMLERYEKLKASMGYNQNDLPMVLNKEPRLLYLDSNVTKERFQALPRVLNIPQQQVRTSSQRHIALLAEPFYTSAYLLTPPA